MATPSRRVRSSLRDRFAEHIGLDQQQKEDIYLGVAASATWRDLTYWLEILLSAGIATLGLILGSPAVIIGAMLISPLMGPILAAGMAFAAGDLVLAIRSLANLLLSSLLAIAFSTILVVLLPFREMTSEIAARTRPSTLDLVIALFSGAIGSIAVCKRLPGVATAIPGVAIAVALMPPLCVAGYGVGLSLTLDRVQGASVFRGGLLLYLTNLVAITFTSTVVFLAIHLDSKPVRERIREWRRFDSESASVQRLVDRLPEGVRRIGMLPGRLLLLAATLLIIFFPLKQSFDALKGEITRRQWENVIQKKTTAAWQRLFGEGEQGATRSVIDSLTATEDGGRVTINLRVFTNSPVSPEERSRYLSEVARELNRSEDSLRLVLIEVPTSDFHSAVRPRQELVETPRSFGLLWGELRQRTGAAVDGLTPPPGAYLLDHVLSLEGETIRLQIEYLSDTELSPDARSIWAAQLRKTLDAPALAVEFQCLPASAEIRFGRRESALSAEAQQVLTPLAEVMTQHSRFSLHLLGNDSTRVQAVKNWFLNRDVTENRIISTIDPGTDHVSVRLRAAG